jgi:hypothetical protein
MVKTEPIYGSYEYNVKWSDKLANISINPTCKTAIYKKTVPEEPLRAVSVAASNEILHFAH